MDFSKQHVSFMKRAIQLAHHGHGKVSPNPMVGCVIVHKNEIIGEGWHQQYGGPHAEVNAINSVKEKAQLPGAEVYVTLEPCSHYGKTPPCADLLIKVGVKTVFIACVDPNPVVKHNGIQKLKEAGIQVRTGLLEKEASDINKRFFTFHRHSRPYIILKYAQTSDGFIARENFDSRWISNSTSRKFVHQWRAEEDAILVGKNTALYDNPKLTVRDWHGQDPIRILIDHQLALEGKDLHLFDHQTPTLCYNNLKELEQTNLSFIKIEKHNFLHKMMDSLAKKQIQSLIVEGGAQTLQTFIDAGLWDEARVFTSKQVFNQGIKAASFEGRHVSQRKIKDDLLDIYVPIR